MWDSGSGVVLSKKYCPCFPVFLHTFIVLRGSGVDSGKVAVVLQVSQFDFCGQRVFPDDSDVVQIGQFLVMGHAEYCLDHFFREAFLSEVIGCYSGIFDYIVK